MDRRKFLKVSGYLAGGLTVAGASGTLLLQEKAVHFDANDSYWAKVLLPENPELKTNIEVDIAIIGGGYSGLSSAYHLMKYNPKLKVVVLEAKHVGHGASGRHGGMLLPQPPTESFEIWDSRNSELHKQTYFLTVDSLRKIKELVENSGMECDLKLEGYCHTIIDSSDIPYYQQYIGTVKQLGMPLELWDEEKTASQLGTEYYAASVFDPNGGSLHAVKFINILKKSAEKLGVNIFENSQVNEIQEGKEIELLVNQQYKVTASKIILATNAYTSKLGYFQNTILPVHAQTAVSKPLSEAQLETIGWESRLPYYDSRNFLFHLVLRDDNRLVIGGGNADYYFRGDLHYQGDMNSVMNLTRAELLRLYPSLNGLEFENIWDGLLAMTADEVPRIGSCGKFNNIYYGLGYNGQGVNMSFMFGDVLASVIVGKSHGWEKTVYFNYDGGLSSYIPPEPFRWIGSTLLMNYYNREDKKMIE